MRAAAAWLNAAHEGLGYPLRRYGKADGVVGFVQRVDEAIASGNAKTMETLKNELDAANNLGCPLNWSTCTGPPKPIHAPGPAGT